MVCFPNHLPLLHIEGEIFVFGCLFASFTAAFITKICSCVKIVIFFSSCCFKLLYLFVSSPHCVALLTCFLFLPAPAGLLVPHRGEVRRHAEGQGAAASAAAAGAADAAAQQCDHLGGPDGPGGPHSTVSGSKTTSTLGSFSFL